MDILTVIEKIFAAVVVVACVLLLVRLCLGETRRRRLDSALRRTWYGWRRTWWRLWTWRASRRHAARLAEDVIRRAKDSVERDGNVYKPKSFKRPRKPH